MRRTSVLALATAVAAGGAARANGTAQPDTVSFLTGADTPDDFALNTTFGFLFSEDAGTTWAWTCHEAVIGAAPFTPAATRAPDGTFYVTVPLALGADPTLTLWRSADRGCSWAGIGGPLQHQTVRALAFRPGGGATVLAAGSRPGGIAAAWRSTDGGVTFGAPLLEVPEHVFTTVHYAPSDPQRVYIAALKQTAPQSSTLYRSDDGGDTWTAIPFPFVEQPPIRVLAVDPADADTLWLRNDAATDRVFFSTDGGVSFSLSHAIDADVEGLALTGGGATRWLAVRRPEGLLRATATSPAFVALPGSPTARCVAAEGDRVYVCAHPYLDPWAAATTTDGATFDTAFAFTRVGGPRACPAGSLHATVCDPLWPQVAQNLGLAAPTPGPSPTPTPRGGDGGSGGCRCSLGSAAARALPPATLPLALVALLARRARFRSRLWKSSTRGACERNHGRVDRRPP